MPTSTSSSYLSVIFWPWFEEIYVGKRHSFPCWSTDSAALVEADAEVCQRAISSVKRYFPTSDLLHNNVADAVAVVPRSLSIRRSERKQRVVGRAVGQQQGIGAPRHKCL